MIEAFLILFIDEEPQNKWVNIPACQIEAPGLFTPCRIEVTERKWGSFNDCKEDMRQLQITLQEYFNYSMPSISAQATCYTRTGTI